MRAGTKLVAALAVAVLAAALLGGCGSSDSETTGSSSATTTAAEGDSGAKQSEGSGDGQSVANGADNPGAADKGPAAKDTQGETSTPLRVTGGGSAQFRSEKGDNSIQDFGEESGESELDQAAEAVHGFYVARAEEDWARACSYLSKSMIDQLEQLVAQSQGSGGQGCAAALDAFTAPLPAAVRRETTVVDAASLRREDDRGFFIYRGAEGIVYAMPLQDEEGEWKLALLSATPLS